MGLAQHDAEEDQPMVAIPTDLFPITPESYVNDRAIRRRLVERGSALLDAGETVSLADLATQRDRTHCTLKLPAPSLAAQSPTDVYASRLSSVLIVSELYHCGKCEKLHVSTAAGFFITSDGVFVTNHHVFDGDRGVTLVAMTSDGIVHPVLEVLAANKGEDVAIARIPIESSPAIPLQGHAPVGSPIGLISHPDRRYYMLTQGHVARYSRRQRRSGIQSRMAVTADFAKGSSGGPVLNAQGNAVGMVCSTHSIYYEPDQNHLQMVLKHCIPAAEILKLID